MRYRRTLLLLCILLSAVLPLARAAWADSGAAPAWSPDWGPQPIMPPGDPSKVADVKGVTGMTKDIITAPVPPPDLLSGPVDVSSVPWDNNLPVVTMPLVYGNADYVIPPATAIMGPAPAVPPITLVETPHDGSVNAIEVPDGGTVLVDGTVVTGGTGIGTWGVGTIFPPPDPPVFPENWDNIGGTGNGIPSFNAPILP